MAEQLIRIQPPSDSTERDMFVQTLFNCAFDMTGDIDDATSVLQAAMAVGTAANEGMG